MLRCIDREFLASLLDAPRHYRCEDPLSPTRRTSFRSRIDELRVYEEAGLITLRPLPDAHDRTLAEQTITASLTAAGREILEADA
jgi:hypothetical protein